MFTFQNNPIFIFFQFSQPGLNKIDSSDIDKKNVPNKKEGSEEQQADINEDTELEALRLERDQLLLEVEMAEIDLKQIHNIKVRSLIIVIFSSIKLS